MVSVSGTGEGREEGGMVEETRGNKRNEGRKIGAIE